MNVEKLRKEQKKIAKKVIAEDSFKKAELFCGVDIGYSGKKAKVVAVTMNKDFNVVERKSMSAEITFPYIPTFLAFREGEPIIKIMKKLRKRPDVLFIDGHGLSHPFRCGLACYVGVMLGTPTIGIAKRKLFGKRGKDYAVFSKRKRPIYISVGHKISLDSALKFTKYFCRYRVPEPLRQAHLLSKL